MRYARNLDNKRVTLDNSFNDKKDIQQLNITKYYNRFKFDHNSTSTKHSTMSTYNNNSKLEQTPDFKFIKFNSSPRCVTDYKGMLESKIENLNNKYSTDGQINMNSFKLHKKYKN